MLEGDSVSYDSDDEVGGDRINRAGNEFASGFIPTWSGFLAIALCGMLLFADLALGPFFLYAQADNKGVEMDLLAQVTPWVFSIAMTGLLYGLWETFAVSYSKAWIKALAIIINVADTLTDVGGASWLFTQDPRAGQQFWHLSGTPYYQVALIYILGAACFFHEPLLGWILAQKKNSVDVAAEFGDPGIGERMEIWLVKFAGVVLNMVKFAGKMGATFMLPTLDLILTPLQMDIRADPIAFWIVVGASIALTAIQSNLWRRTREHGGIKETIASSKRGMVMVYALIPLVLIDTYFDIRGYNDGLYGEPGSMFLVISSPTPSWMLTIGILAVLCSCGELMGREVFTILGRQSASIRKGGSSPLLLGGIGVDTPPSTSDGGYGMPFAGEPGPGMFPGSGQPDPGMFPGGHPGQPFGGGGNPGQPPGGGGNPYDMG